MSNPDRDPEADCAGDPRWSVARARSWWENRPLPVGCNFIPSTAINQLEMWQASTFDAPTVGRELGWAGELGFNAVRIYLHDLLWQDDAQGFLGRMDEVLGLADRAGIAVIPVLFDDVWNPEPRLGPQPDP
ncbi:MAG: 1,4-beta-xylanase, partial [Myxococcota bacterium]|nr:1,4-beta-xylanase [Myxococcota bacterium]